MTTTSDQILLPERLDASVPHLGSTASIATAPVDGPEIIAGTHEVPPTHDRIRTRLARALTSVPGCVAMLFGLGLVLRLIEIRRSYDIFIDEVTYTRIAMNLAHGAGLTLYGQPFNLHPPAVFGLFAGVIWAFGWHGGVEQTLFQLRNVTAVCGAIVPVAVFLLLNRAVSRRVALAAGVVLALDPFAIFYDSRVMLEAPAQLGVAGMFAFIAAAVCTKSSRARTWLVWGAGLSGAVAVTSKETFGMVALVSLAVLAVTGWVMGRRQTLTIIGVTAAGYALAVLGAATSTGIGAWWQAKYDDVLRLVGVHQVTGFNAPTTHVTLLSRALADASLYAATYTLLTLGTLAAAGLMLRLRPWRNGSQMSMAERVLTLLSVWTLVAGAYLVYATVFGSIEEQMYYILLAPAVASLAAWLARAGAGAGTRRQRSWRRVAVALLTLIVAVDGLVWVSVHSRPDNEYQQMLAWEAANIPAGSVISATDYTGQFLISNAVLGQWNTIPELIANHVQYVLLATTLVEQGYGLGSTAFMQTLNQKGRIVFEVNGSSEGSLRLYDVTAITGAARS
jgi:Dolichyl-phosphate-mannose-protein mannosyltransferase